MTSKHQQRKEGFALLLTLIVVSIVLAVGLSLLNITIKQLTLSATARNSEVAFQAAYTGIECTMYRIRQARQAPSGGASGSITCGGRSGSVITAQSTNLGSNRTATHLEYRFDIPANGSQSAMCIETSTYELDTEASTAAITNYTLNDEGLADLDCPAGSLCTAVFSRGYNRSCGDLDSIFTVQREIATQF